MDRIIYFIYRGVTALITLLPLETGFRLGAAAGWLAYWIVAPYRRIALRNFAIAFEGEKSPAQLRAMARKHFALLGGNLVSSIKVASLSEEAIRGLITIEGREHFEEATRKGRGVITTIGHMGNWEIIAQIGPLIFPNKGGTIYQQLGNRFIDADIRAARARQGLTLFERKEGFQGVIEMLRQGGGVGILVDQHAGDKGIWSPLFGRLASTTPLAATIALRTGAAVIPTAISTIAPGRWRMTFLPPLDPASGDPAIMTAEMNQALERMIRASPEDWFWVHNRWKTPQPNFLLENYKRGVVLPPGMTLSQLKPFRILIRSSNWLGDAVMTTPAVQAIKRGRPDAHVTVLVKAKLADYWKRVAEADEVIAIEPGDSVFSVARKIEAGGPFEAAVIFPNSVRSALEPWLAGVPRRIGYPAKWRSRLLNQPLLPKKKKKGEIAPPAPHQVHHYLELARRIGAKVDFKPGAAPSEFFGTPPLAGGAKKTEGGDSPGPFRIGVCPGAEYGPAKRWLPERFAEAARAVSQSRLKGRGCEWLLFGVAGDAPVGDAIAKHLEEFEGTLINLIGKTTLAELMDRLAGCDLLLTNDTGTMHLAAALGVRTVAVFGSTEPRLTGPLGPGHHILRHQVECSPCFQRECPLDFRCMKAVTAQEAAAAVGSILEA